MGGKEFLAMMSFPFVFKNMASYTFKMLDEGDCKQITVPFPSQERVGDIWDPPLQVRGSANVGEALKLAKLSTRACH